MAKMADKKLKTLKDSLKELVNPACNIKLGDSDDEYTFAKVSENVEEENDTNACQEFGNLQKKTAFQDDYFERKYQGSKISRNNLSGWNDHDDSMELNGIDKDNDADASVCESSLASSDNIQSNAESEDDIESGDLDNDSDNSIPDDEFDSSMKIDMTSIPKDLLQSLSSATAKEENVSGVEDEELESDVENIFKSKQTQDRKKGQATKQQLQYLDSLLESRIRLQKSLQVTNTLPQHNIMASFQEQGSSQVKDSYQAARQSVCDLLDNLMKFQEALFSSNEETNNILDNIDVEKPTKESTPNDDEEIPSDTDDEDGKEDEEEEENENKNNISNASVLPSKRKRHLNICDYEEELNKRHKAFEGYRDSTIKRWYEKTKLMTGKLNKNFGAFERSTLQQIKQVMTDNERLVKRTQLKRTQYKVLGRNETDENESLVDSHLKDYDTQIFDDGDFYHEMLKELIERKSNITSDDPIASGRKWLELQQLRTKIKRKIDTRASKGRKVRYQVHPKLVSFMAPQDVGKMSNQARNDLFSSLFGGLNKSQ